MKERLTLTTEELRRLKAMELVEAGRLDIPRAVQLLQVSERQGWRILARYRKEGAAGLVHGNRGRPSPRRLGDGVRAAIVKLAEGQCRDYNDQHLTEVLHAECDLQVSRTSVRRVRRAAGLASPKKYRRRRGHQRRERYAQAGMLLQLDASLHGWLEERGPRLALLAAIDDATGELVGAHFRAQEDAAGYFLLMQGISQTHGLPLAVYADRHTIFQSPGKPTVEQELAGEVPKSQFARLLAELGIQLIAAHSPQAKGRIERLWQTLQDRLVKELRRAGAATLEQANQLLVTYLPTFNQRFMVPPTQAGSAFRPLPDDYHPDLAFAFLYQRTVANDHTISLDNHKLQLPPLAQGRSYARAKVQLRHCMDGRLLVLYQGELLTTFLPAEPGPPRVEHFRPVPSTPTPLRPAQPLRQPLPTTQPAPSPKPAQNHPWRNYGASRTQTPPQARLPTDRPQNLPVPATTDTFTERLR
jgi:transposase